MPNRKKIVCRCEDVTDWEINKAIASGRRDIESLKREVGIGTGPCQGKSCMAHVIGMLSRKTGKKPDEIGTTRSRQPVQSVELSILAKGAKSSGRKKTAGGKG